MKTFAAAVATLTFVLGTWAYGWSWVKDFEARMVENVEDHRP